MATRTLDATHARTRTARARTARARVCPDCGSDQCSGRLLDAGPTPETGPVPAVWRAAPHNVPADWLSYVPAEMWDDLYAEFSPATLPTDPRYGTTPMVPTIEVLNAPAAPVAFSDPVALADYLATTGPMPMRDLTRETQRALWFDADHRLVGDVLTCRGSKGQCGTSMPFLLSAVPPTAVAVVMVHNHPANHAGPACYDAVMSSDDLHAAAQTADILPRLTGGAVTLADAMTIGRDGTFAVLNVPERFRSPGQPFALGRLTAGPGRVRAQFRARCDALNHAEHAEVGA